MPGTGGREEEEPERRRTAQEAKTASALHGAGDATTCLGFSLRPFRPCPGQAWRKARRPAASPGCAPLSGASRSPCDRRRCVRAAAPPPSEAARARIRRPRSPALASASWRRGRRTPAPCPAPSVADSVTRYATRAIGDTREGDLAKRDEVDSLFRELSAEELGRASRSGRAGGASPGRRGVGDRFVDLRGRADEHRLRGRAAGLRHLR